MGEAGGRRFSFEEFETLYPATFRAAWRVLPRRRRTRPRAEDEVRALARALAAALRCAERDGEYVWVEPRRLRIRR